MERTYYPDFDVMEAQEAWDPHTRDIVTRRLEAGKSLTALTPGEAALLESLLRHLLYEERADILGFVVSHFDKKVAERFGEGQRKAGVPEEDQLIRQGLIGLDDVAKHRHGQPWMELSVEEQVALVRELQSGSLEPVGMMAGLPQKELFDKVLSLALEAYASHPQVWSEMGYGGPAYPRGYYRIEQGLRDPWEPQPAKRSEGP